METNSNNLVTGSKTEAKKPKVDVKSLEASKQVKQESITSGKTITK